MDDDLKGLTTAEINERLGYGADAGIVPDVPVPEATYVPASPPEPLDPADDEA